LPHGLATEVGEKGVGLSVGERQRLQLARLLVDRPRLLVLDEATANLDYATEMEVRASLEEILPDPPCSSFRIASASLKTRITCT
jgi:ATP-binding cassette, subfamily B, bacterial